MKQFGTMRPGRRTRPPLVRSALAMRTQEPRNFVSAAAGPFRRQAVLLRSSRPRFRTRWPAISRYILQIASGVGADRAVAKHAPVASGVL